MKYVRRIGLITAVILLGLGCQTQQDTITIKLGHGLDRSHSVHQAMLYMGDRLAEKSDSTMLLDIHPSEQIGTERELLELLQIGSVDMTKVSSAVMEGFSDPYKVFGLPYVFRNEAHRHAVMEGEVGREILLSSQDILLRGLTFYDAGTRSFYTTDVPIRKPEDLGGLNIRTMNSSLSIRMVRAMGGAATPISFGELYTALQQGVVDGAENNAPSFYLTNHYELCDYYTLDEHTAPQDVLLVSTHLWDRLSPQQRTWLQEAANESATYQKKLWTKANNEAMEAVKKAGVEIIKPDKSAFVEAVQPVYKYYERTAPRVYDLYKKVRSVEVER